MKKIFTLSFALFLIIQFPSFSQWEWVHPEPAGVSWVKVHFVDSNKGVAIGGGQVIKTNDGGANWKTIQKIPSTVAMDFKGSYGMVVGYYGTVYNSQDNGNTWQSVPVNIYDDFNRVQIISSDTIFLASASGSIYRTYNAGKTWKKFTYGPRPYDIDFVDGKVGFMGLDRGKILKTVDGGETWNISHPEINIIPSEIYLLQFINKEVGFAFRGHNEMLKTIDGGKSWKVINQLHDKIISMHFINNLEGFMGGEHGAMYKTQDAGKTWTWMSADNGRIDFHDILAVHFTSSTSGHALGEMGRILKTIDGGKTWKAYASTYVDIADLDFPTNTVGYAFAHNKVLKTTNGGDTWQPLQTNTIEAQQGKFFDENTGISIGTGGKVYKTYDGGETWKTIKIPGISLLTVTYSSFFLDDKIGFVSGGYNGFYYYFAKTEDGGETWQVITSKAFRSLCFLNEQVGFSTEYGNLLKTQDGGKTWQSILHASEEDIESIFFIDDKLGFMACENGIVEKTMDGGNTWKAERVYQDYYDDLRIIKFFDKNIGYLTGEYNSVFKTVDGGKTWQREGYSYNACNVIEFTPNYKVFLGGKFASIQRREMAIEKYSIDDVKITDVTYNSATFSSNISATYGSVDSVRFSYGYTNVTETISASPNSISNHRTLVKATAKGLKANTKYKVNVKLFHKGKWYYSDVYTFTTSTEEIVTGVKEDIQEKIVQVYPNPTNKYIFIIPSAFINKLLKIEVLDLNGKLIMESEKKIIDVSGLKDGLYLLKINDGKNVGYKKIVKQGS